MMDELKLCPFCGGFARMERTDELYEYGTGGPNSVTDYGYIVFCVKCSAGLGLMDTPPNSPEQAAAAWNSRPLEDEITRRYSRQCDEYRAELVRLRHDPAPEVQGPGQPAPQTGCHQ